MRFTKIIATVGPASNSEKTLTELIKSGTDAFRFNLSHANHAEHKKTLRLIRKVSKKIGRDVAILFDLAGPKLRVGSMKEPVILGSGDKFILTSRKVEGSKQQVSVNQARLIKDLSVKDKILLNEGAIKLEVIEKTASDLVCKVKQGGLLQSNKGINISANINVKPLTKKDYEDIDFAISLGVDWLALSFVRKSSDIRTLKKYLAKKKSLISVMAKIEKREAVENIDAIIEEADAVMIARGDLGVELPVEEVPIIQKNVIAKSMRCGKIVVIATQMLDSMIRNPSPTRAEVSDIANSIYDQTDAVMLSGETAIGKYPVLALKTMARVICKTEEDIDYGSQIEEKYGWVTGDVTDAISFASCEIVHDIGARLLVTSTQSGATAIRAAAYRCPALILAVTPDEDVKRKLTLVWGVFPLLIKPSKDINDMFAKAKTAAIKSSLVKPKDKIVITAGALVNVVGTTNLIKVDII